MTNRAKREARTTPNAPTSDSARYTFLHQSGFSGRWEVFDTIYLSQEGAKDAAEDDLDDDCPFVIVEIRPISHHSAVRTREVTPVTAFPLPEE